VVLLLCTLAACGASQKAATANTALVYVRCPVPDAYVWVDERVIGRVDEVQGGMRVKAGTHRLQLRHDRYHTRYVELELAAGETKTLDLTLSELLD
jgi:hypothetical protein